MLCKEKSAIEKPTFALTADVSEAHRQVPVHPQDLHFRGCQASPGSDVYVGMVGTFRCGLCVVQLPESCGSHRACGTVIGKTARTCHLHVRPTSIPVVQRTATHRSASSSFARLAMYRCRSRKLQGAITLSWSGLNYYTRRDTWASQDIEQIGS